MSRQQLKILYVGHGSGESLGEFLVKALCRLEQDVRVLDTNAVAPAYEAYVKKLSAAPSVHRLPPVLLRLGRQALAGLRSLSRGAVLSGIHRRLWREAVAFRPDLLLVVRGHWLEPQLLADLKQKPGCLAFFYHSEDFRDPTYYSAEFLEAIPLYDAIFTVIRANVPEYLALGAPRAAYLPFGYDPEVHRPVRLPETERARWAAEVAFLGKWSRARQALLETLAETAPVTVRGFLWERVPRDSPLTSYLRGPAPLEAVAAVLSSAKVVLNPLNDQGRMEHVMRTFEIPACGAFQLARRTAEHLDFFVEDREIVCFDSAEELKDKVAFYLRHQAARERIARAGHERLRRDAHSYLDRVRTLLQAARELRGKPRVAAGTGTTRADVEAQPRLAR